MLRVTTLCLLLLLSQNALAEICAAVEQPLTATYSITKTLSHSGKSSTNELILWREAGRVAHQYPTTEITELWERPAHGMIKPTRFFDHHKRAIEYQPGEAVNGKMETDWSHRFALVSDSLIKKMKVVSQSGENCELKQQLELNASGKSIAIVWWPNKQLVETLSVDNGRLKENWKLDSVVMSPENFTAFFAHRADYYATDFADIGDDHTDPFLTNMVNLGFIEHSASGFYDEHGNAIGEHAH